MGQGDRPAATMTRTQRFFNIKGAFEVNLPELIAGKNILLVDDVLITGATEKEAEKWCWEDL